MLEPIIDLLKLTIFSSGGSLLSMCSGAEFNVCGWGGAARQKWCLPPSLLFCLIGYSRNNLCLVQKVFRIKDLTDAAFCHGLY